MESIFKDLGGICGKRLYAKRGIVVIHYGNITLCPLGYEANHFVRTMVTYLQPMGMETTKHQALTTIILVPFYKNNFIILALK